MMNTIDDKDPMESFILHHHNSFYEGELPEGHFSRFQRERRQRRVSRYGTVLAGVLLLALFLMLPLANPYDEPHQVVKEHQLRMNAIESDILSLCKTMDPGQANETIRAVRHITFEAIPLSEQLPQELPKQERIRILNQYYQKKTDGLIKLKNLLVDHIQEERKNF